MRQQQGTQQKMYSQMKMTVTTMRMMTMQLVVAVAVQQRTSLCKPATARSPAGKHARLQQQHMQQAQQHQALQETALATKQATNQVIIMPQLQQQHLQGLMLPLMTMLSLARAVHRSESMNASSTSASSSMQRQQQLLLALHLASAAAEVVAALLMV
jgi:hypothetical protein